MARFCPACGHELGVGRFCTNCGQPRPADPAPAPAPASTERPDPAAPGPDTEERRAARREAAMAPGPPRTPPTPPTADVPPPARFPLFADEQDGEAPDATRPVHLPGLHDPHDPAEEEPAERSGLLGVFAGEQTATGLRPVAGDDEEARSAGEALARLHHAARGGERHPAPPRRRRRGGLLAALVVVLLLAVVAVAGVVWLRLRDDGGDVQAEDPAAAGRDLAPQATVEVPGTARPSQEVGGAEVSYDAANLVDGDPETAWRVAGNAAGDRIVLTFPTRISVTRLGLVNGYAKRSTDARGRVFDWYHGHRTVTRVVWRLDGGTELPQPLERTRELQTIDVPPGVTTRRITLRLEQVAAPGTGRAGRDFTALSEIVVDGTEG